jgi:hypothetical protein
MRVHKSFPILTILVLLAAPAFAAAQAGGGGYGPRLLWERVEIALTVGYGQSLVDWTSLHLRQWSTPFYPSISAQNRLQLSTQSALFAGGSATFFFRSGLALQGGFGYLKTGVTNETRFEFRYSRPPAFSGLETFTGTGELTTVPVYVNVINALNVFRGAAGRKIKGSLFIGPALFFNSLSVNAAAGAGAVIQTSVGGVPDERADAFEIPVSVEDKSWVSLGGNLGLAFDYQVIRPLALTLEGRFFYAPKKNLVWKWEAGSVGGLYGNIPQLDFTETMAAENMENTTPITVKPSCFQISAGIKIVF